MTGKFRQVSYNDGNSHVKYEYTPRNNGYQIVPRWGQSFWVSDLEKADEIQIRLAERYANV